MHADPNHDWLHARISIATGAACALSRRPRLP